MIQNYADRFSVTGTDAAGDAVHTIGASSTSFAAAPAMEYNWSGTVGIIFGIELSASGRNTGSYVAPQIALSTAFF